MFSSNSVVHDGVGWVCVGNVETAIGSKPLLQNRRRVSRPPSDIPDGSSDLGILVFVLQASGRLEFSFVAHHRVHDYGETSCQCDSGFSHRGPCADCPRPVFEFQ